VGLPLHSPSRAPTNKWKEGLPKQPYAPLLHDLGFSSPDPAYQGFGETIWVRRDRETERVGKTLSLLSGQRAVLTSRGDPPLHRRRAAIHDLVAADRGRSGRVRRGVRGLGVENRGDGVGVTIVAVLGVLRWTSRSGAKKERGERSCFCSGGAFELPRGRRRGPV
jgi:hypothetical protein